MIAARALTNRGQTNRHTKMNAIRSTRLLLLAAATAVTLVAGCAAPWSTDWHTSDMFDLKKPWPFKDDDGPKKGTPVRMASTWTDTL